MGMKKAKLPHLKCLVVVWLPSNHQKQNTKNNGIIFLRYFRIRMKKLKDNLISQSIFVNTEIQ